MTRSHPIAPPIACRTGTVAPSRTSDVGVLIPARTVSAFNDPAFGDSSLHETAPTNPLRRHR